MNIGKHILLAGISAGTAALSSGVVEHSAKSGALFGLVNYFTAVPLFRGLEFLTKSSNNPNNEQDINFALVASLGATFFSSAAVAWKATDAVSERTFTYTDSLALSSISLILGAGFASQLK
jgi:hypothetical protein